MARQHLNRLVNVGIDGQNRFDLDGLQNGLDCRRGAGEAQLHAAGADFLGQTDEDADADAGDVGHAGEIEDDGRGFRARDILKSRSESFTFNQIKFAMERGHKDTPAPGRGYCHADTPCKWNRLP